VRLTSSRSTRASGGTRWLVSGSKTPDDAPHATDYVADMVELIASFLERDVAYQTSDGVYFDVSAVADYGLLAGQPLESLRAGARVEANDEKRSPLDFALWKNAKPDEPRWPSPFGEGRPGWHTECVVMSLDLLGEGFDLHCGGLDLKFPPTTRTNGPRPKPR
jgi:cysteinyl-tRNA synthetase